MKMRKWFLVAVVAMAVIALVACSQPTERDNRIFSISLAAGGLSEGTLTLASFHEGAGPSHAEVTITNTGNQPTGELTVAVDGTNFTLNPATSIESIVSGETATFTVTAAALSAAGSPHTATVTVTGGNGILAEFIVSVTVTIPDPIPAARAELALAIEEAEDRNESDYTPASWATFYAALNAARDVYEDGDATLAQINDALADLNEAMEGLELDLVPAARAELRTLLDAANLRQQANYTAASWTPFAQARTAAQTAYDTAAATAEALNNARTALYTAMEGLELDPVPAARNALANAIEEAEDRNESDYTPASWATFYAALNAARDVYEDGDATLAQINDALADLNEAMDDLELATDVLRAALAAALAAAPALQGDFTASTWNAFTAARDAAQGTLDNQAASAADLQSALADLDGAIASLTTYFDEALVALEEAIAEVEALTPAVYTAASWAAVDAALDAARDELDYADTTIASLNAAREALELAVDALETVADFNAARAALGAVLAVANPRIQGNYTTASWAPFGTARTDAQTAHADATTIAALNNARTALATAMSGLARTPALYTARTNLQTAIDTAVARLPNEANYTGASWTDFEEALAAAQAAYDNPNSTVTQINEALADLNTASGNLTTLVGVARAALGLILAEANLRQEPDYTPVSWDAFNSARAQATTMYGNAGATVAQLDGARNALITAMAGLVTLVEDARGNLATVITTAEARNAADYTPESWVAFLAALGAANIALEDADTVAALNTARTNLEGAMNALVRRITGTMTIDFAGFRDNPIVTEPVVEVTLAQVLAGNQIVATGVENARWYRGNAQLSATPTLTLNADFARVGRHVVTVRATYDNRSFSQMVNILVVE